MSDFDKTKLRRLDVTVLLVFSGLMRLGKATLVAEELGLTNSSISHALRRLRDVFGDELFLRRPHGLEPTAFARSIEPAVQSALEALQGALAGPDSFEPAHSDAHVRLAAQDYEIATIVPALLARMRASAPGMTLSIQALAKTDALKALEAGDVDLALGFFPELAATFLSTFLLEETYLVAAHPSHPFLQGWSGSRRLSVRRPSSGLRGCDHVWHRRSGVGCAGIEAARGALRAPVPACAGDAARQCDARDPARCTGEGSRRTIWLGLRAAAGGRSRFSVQAVRHMREEKNPMINWLIDELQASMEPAAPQLK
jgi:DNA-binding transcriptional LysR family regulator